jgi:hypothetical protein
VSAKGSAEAWLEPLDRARTALFVRALRFEPLRPLLLAKRRRIPALLLAHAAVAFVLSVFAPTLLLVLGPLLLGVPHLLADIRYLVLRPRFAAPARRWLLGGCVVLLGVRLAELTFAVSLSRYELPLAVFWVGGCALLGAQRLRDPRLIAMSVLLTAFGAAAWFHPSYLKMALSHGHNALAVAVWAFAFCPARRIGLAIFLLLAAITFVLLLTPLAGLGLQHGIVQSFGLHSLAVVDQLAPFARSLPLALGVVAAFAFLQSLHYAVWLHAIPQEVTRGEGTLSFRMSFRALRSDLGLAGGALSTLLVVTVPVCGVLAPLRTQAVYLSLASFHAYLELGALSLCWLARLRLA